MAQDNINLLAPALSFGDAKTADVLVELRALVKNKNPSAEEAPGVAPGGQSTKSPPLKRVKTIPSSEKLENSRAPQEGSVDELRTDLENLPVKKLLLHKEVLTHDSLYFEARLARWTDTQQSLNKHIAQIRVEECRDVRACAKALQLLYAESLPTGRQEEEAFFDGIADALAVLQASTFLLIEKSIKACCAYLESLECC